MHICIFNTALRSKQGYFLKTKYSHSIWEASIVWLSCRSGLGVAEKRGLMAGNQSLFKLWAYRQRYLYFTLTHRTNVTFVKRVNTKVLWNIRIPLLWSFTIFHFDYLLVNTILYIWDRLISFNFNVNEKVICLNEDWIKELLFLFSFLS